MYCLSLRVFLEFTCRSNIKPTKKLSRQEANMQQQEKSWNANYEVIDKLLCQERKEGVDNGTLYCGLAN